VSALVQFSTDFGQPTPAAPERRKASFSEVEQSPRKPSHLAFFVTQGLEWERPINRHPSGEFTPRIAFEFSRVLRTAFHEVEGIKSDKLLEDVALATLDAFYVIDNRPAVVHFIQANRLYRLLVQAREPLKEAFGDVTRKLSLVRDDEGYETLFCSVITTAALQDARRTLAAFDDNWWVDRSGQVVGKLNFDFELI
jgi:hypothetical protein